MANPERSHLTERYVFSVCPVCREALSENKRKTVELVYIKTGEKIHVHPKCYEYIKRKGQHNEFVSP